MSVTHSMPRIMRVIRAPVTHSMPRIMRVIREPVTERIVRVTRKPVSTVASAPVVGKPINEHRGLKFDPWKLRRELARLSGRHAGGSRSLPTHGTRLISR